MTASPFIFEPIYQALASRLIAGCTFAFTGDLAQGSQAITNIPDTSSLFPGLAVLGPLVPQGAFIQTVGANQVTMNLGAIDNGAAQALKSGTASTDPNQVRLLRHWTDVPQAEQPAIFLSQLGELGAKRPAGQPEKWTLDCMVWVYAMGPDINSPATPALNAMLSGVRMAFVRDTSGPGAVQNRQTLGGLVFDAWIEGRIETDEGVLGQQAVAKVPVTILQNGP